MLGEGIEASLQGVARDGNSEGGLRAGVVGGAIVGGCSGCVAGIGVVACLVVVEERRSLEHGG